jgi:hypothetical protein
MKLLSELTRNRAAAASSSLRPMRPSGVFLATLRLDRFGGSGVGACRSQAPPSMPPTVMTLTRMRRSFSSEVRTRAKDRSEALAPV